MKRLKPIWTYGIPLWRTTGMNHINKIATMLRTRSTPQIWKGYQKGNTQQTPQRITRRWYPAGGIRSVSMKPEFACRWPQLIMQLSLNCVIDAKSLLTFHKHFRLRTIQVSYNSIICNSVEQVEFCAWKRRFADNIDFLLPFEENCCRIASNACRSLR